MGQQVFKTENLINLKAAESSKGSGIGNISTLKEGVNKGQIRKIG